MPGPADEGGRVRVAVRAVWRTTVVTWQFLPLAVAYLRDRRRFVLFGPSRSVTPERQRARARYLLETFVGLGPAFIKFGQMLSTRPDVLPGPYVTVLSELQDRVPPDDWEAVRPVVEAGVGPVDEAYDDFDTDPISGASLGQVYTAEYRGDPVAVKVLRPGVRVAVEADLRVIGTLLPWVVRFAPPGQRFTLENLAEEFAATIREEMDYAHEAAMLREIGANFADDPGVRVPDVVDARSTDRVLTMSYVDGVKVTDVETLDDRGVDRAALARRLEEIYIQMIVEDGVFHADPHPGNLAVQADGTVVFYDFGMTGRLDEQTRAHLLEFYVALAADDVGAVMDAFVAMGALDPEADREMMRQVFDLAIEEFRGEDIETYQIAELVGEFESELYDFPMRLPRDLALVVRVTTILEGVCRTLDPGFDFVEVVTEYVADRQRAAVTSPETLSAGSEAAAATVRSVLRAPPKLDRALTRLDRDDVRVRAGIEDGEGVVAALGRRVALGSVLAASVVAVALLYALDRPLGAGAAGAVALLAGGLLYRSFRAGRVGRAAGAVTRRAFRGRRGRE